jgi:hypothetical protein
MTASAVNVISVRQGCNAPLRIDVSHIGQPLKIAGRVFGRGFGAHAHSEIRLVSGQPMREFRARVGFDDNPILRSQLNLPELTFSVQAGGRMLWSSNPMRLGDAAQEAMVTLEGVKELCLHIRASREGATATSVEYYGQANWVDPEVRLADGTVVELGRPQSTSRATEAASPGGKYASEFSAADRDVIRRLAEEVAQIAALPEQKRRIGEWKRLNGLRHGKPLVMIYTAESPLHELDPGSELALQTKDSFCRHVEQELRLRLFQWKHVRCDMVMEPLPRGPGKNAWRRRGCRSSRRRRRAEGAGPRRRPGGRQVHRDQRQAGAQGLFAGGGRENRAGRGGRIERATRRRDDPRQRPDHIRRVALQASGRHAADEGHTGFRSGTGQVYHAQVPHVADSAGMGPPVRRQLRQGRRASLGVTKK